MTAQHRTGATQQQLSGDIALIRPRDPLVLRDARPFSTEPGARAFSLSWPLPRTVSGTIRSHIGDRANLNWHSRGDALQARQIVSHGPLMVAQTTPNGAWQVHVPAPRDVVFYRPEGAPNDLSAMVLRPKALREHEGCDLPKPQGEPETGFEKALANTDVRPLSVTDDIKPESSVPKWWSLADAVIWLNTTEICPPANLLPFSEAPDRNGKQTLRGLQNPELETRMHVSIDPDTGTNREGALFATEARVFRDAPDPESGEPALGMLCKTSTNLAWNQDRDVVALGGERRTSLITFNEPKASWPDVHFPSDAEIVSAIGLRMLLVTPALFTHGWLPGWMADGTIPGLKGFKLGLKLVGVSIDRRIPVSGWRLARRETASTSPQKPGPRATRYAVPAGGVYFFEFTKEKPVPEIWQQIWERLWLAPVSDRSIDRDEGFGLMLPGLWRNNDCNSV